MPNLSEAITAVEQGQQAFIAAATQTNNDQAAAAAIQAKLDAAHQQVTADQAAQDSAAVAFNTAIDQLIQVATAAKIPVSSPSGS